MVRFLNKIWIVSTGGSNEIPGNPWSVGRYIGGKAEARRQASKQASRQGGREAGGGVGTWVGGWIGKLSR